MRLHNKFAQLFGYELIRSRKHPTLESHLKLLFKHLDINLVIDVGANIGQYGAMLRKKVGYKGHIVSFEPVRAVFKKLSSNIAQDKNWTAYNYALGASEGTLNINVTSSSDFSSFLKPNEFAREVRPSESEINHVEEVTVKCLDNIFTEIISHIGIDSPRIFLKMDTQGYDHEVIKGTKNILTNMLGLQSELSVIPIYDNMPTYIESLTLYRNYNFEITAVYPISRDDKSLQLIEMDCILSKVAK